MNIILSGLFDNVKRRKGYFLFLLVLTVLAIILGIIGAINLGDLSIDLSHIAYIKFLQGGSFGSMIFGLFLSLCIFFFAIMLCHWKTFLLPFGIIFYLYLIYSQTFILVSVILIYGIFNCVILFSFMLIYSILLWTIFMLLMCEFINFLKTQHYFKTCFSLRESKILIWLICLIMLTVVFSLVLMILKKFVILLVFD